MRSHPAQVLESLPPDEAAALFAQTPARLGAAVLAAMLLRRLGQDPATASSIILTTVTDVVGFFSFLGIAALFAPLLAQSGA